MNVVGGGAYESYKIKYEKAHCRLDISRISEAEIFLDLPGQTVV